MKKMLSLLSSITLFATGATATVFSTKTTSNLATLSLNPINNHSENQEKSFLNIRNIDRNTVENILDTILIQKNNDVILNYEYFYHFYNQSNQEVNIAKEFKIENTNIHEIEEMFFYSVENDDGSWFIPNESLKSETYSWLIEKVQIFSLLTLYPDEYFWEWPNDFN